MPCSGTIPIRHDRRRAARLPVGIGVCQAVTMRHAFAILASVFVGFSPAAAQLAAPGTASGIARAVIMHPVTLKITPSDVRLVQDEPLRLPVTARRTDRPCRADPSERCHAFLYDLP
jgi:hypothetical protein